MILPMSSMPCQKCWLWRMWVHLPAMHSLRQPCNISIALHWVLAAGESGSQHSVKTNSWWHWTQRAAERQGPSAKRCGHARSTPSHSAQCTGHACPELQACGSARCGALHCTSVHTALHTGIRDYIQTVTDGASDCPSHVDMCAWHTTLQLGRIPKRSGMRVRWWTWWKMTSMMGGPSQSACTQAFCIGWHWKLVLAMPKHEPYQRG